MEKASDVQSGYSRGRTGEVTVACWAVQTGSGGGPTGTETAMDDVIHSQGSDTLKESMSGTR